VSLLRITVRELIRLAYGVKDYQIAKAPGWIDSERFDIAAKGNGDEQVQVRGLLIERFQLATHREDDYAEVVRASRRDAADVGRDRHDFVEAVRAGCAKSDRS
jgi:hypothetical protein